MVGTKASSHNRSLKSEMLFYEVLQMLNIFMGSESDWPNSWKITKFKDINLLGIPWGMKSWMLGEHTGEVSLCACPVLYPF